MMILLIKLIKEEDPNTGAIEGVFEDDNLSDSEPSGSLYESYQAVTHHFPYIRRAASTEDNRICISE